MYYKSCMRTFALLHIHVCAGISAAITHCEKCRYSFVVMLRPLRNYNIGAIPHARRRESACTIGERSSLLCAKQLIHKQYDMSPTEHTQINGIINFSKSRGTDQLSDGMYVGDFLCEARTSYVSKSATKM